LGDRRARASKEFLQSLGIDPNRIGTVSKGDLEAIRNGTEEQMAQDRRADLLLLKQ
jgi:outer membrane protein OmpA-like peptidoglycan-associated protein